MTNRLAGEASPYLRQHAEDPVDWRPWGEAAFEETRERDVPVFLSVGYSACHWCHVMRRESFSDPEVAELLNGDFVPVKVDREERPDVDAVYMEAVQAMTGRGGWPLTAFLTPRGKPFYGGTYFPPEERGGMLGLKDVLRSISDAWGQDREALLQDAEQVTEGLGGVEGRGDVSEEAMEAAFRNLRRRYDEESPGFGAAPKFPMSPALSLLLRLRGRFDGAAEMLRETLVAMARGGVYDQVGGGFHRYAVDREWRVPHFEKMLYDNAQLLGIYARAHRVTGRPAFCRVVDETADYLLREMRSPEGGFYAAQDADTAGEEGRFYTWTRDEVAEAAGEEAELLCRYFGVTDDGDVDGRSVLTREASLEAAAEAVGMGPEEAEAALRRGREALFEAREDRARPARDEKVIAAWNGLAVEGFVEAGAAGRTPFLDAAEEAASFLREELVDGDEVARYWKDGEAQGDGFLEDYALLGRGFLRLYLATQDPEWFEEARRLGDAALDRFYDPEEAAFYDAEESGDLVARPRTTSDTATPSGGAAASSLLLDLHALTGEERHREAAEEAVADVASLVRSAPTFHGEWLAAMDRLLHPAVTVAVVGDPGNPRTDELLDAARGHPAALTALSRPGAAEVVPLLRDREPIEGEPTAYVCRESVCIRPVTDPGELERLLEQG